LQKKVSNGKKKSADFCMQCHKAGNGSGRTYPPLDGSDWLKKQTYSESMVVKIWL
jgi:cytochrome c553